MNAISCPRCAEQVRVPASVLDHAASPDLVMRCPWCSEEFPLSEVQSRLPPLLEIASPSEMESADDFGSFVDVNSGGEPDSMNFDAAQFAPSLSGSPAAGNVRTRPLTRKKSSPVGMILKMALGGVAAFPIAGVILSLAGKPMPIDLGFYPFQGAGDGSSGRRIVAAPPINQAAAPSPDGSSTTSTRSPRILEPAITDEPVPQSASDFVMPQSASDFVMPGNNDDRIDETDPLVDEDVSGSNQMSTRDASETDPRDSIDFPVSDNVSESVTVTETLAPEASSNIQTELTAELADAISDAKSAVDQAVALFQVDAKDTALLQDAYLRLCEVGAMLDAESSTHPSVTRLLTAVTDSPRLAAMYSDVGPRWPNVRSRRTDGILLIGEIRRSGGSAIMQFGNDQTMSVQSDGSLPTGRVIALGRIADNANRSTVKLVAVKPVSE